MLSGVFNGLFYKDAHKSLNKRPLSYNGGLAKLNILRNKKATGVMMQ